MPFDGSNNEVSLYQRWFADPSVRRYLHPNTPFVGDPSICVDIASWIAHLVRDNRFAYFRIEHPMYGFILVIQP